MKYIVGVDEAGIGTLAGPLVITAAAFKDGVVFSKRIRDSKTLSMEQREELVDEVYDKASFVITAVAKSSHINSSRGIWSVWDEAMAMLLKMVTLFVEGKRSDIIVDGTRMVPSLVGIRYEVKADKRFQQVSAASIVAKYVQTSAMEDIHEQFPEYGFDRHHGYGTVEHREALSRLGPTYEHRAQYRPVKKSLEALPAVRRQEFDTRSYFDEGITLTVIGGRLNGK